MSRAVEAGPTSTPQESSIHASGGTACVAAHSTTRALYSAYNGRLYQVRRASDNTTRDLGVLSAGGYANAATQDSFCSRHELPHHHHLQPVRQRQQPHPGAPGGFNGPAAGGYDNLANATAAPVTVAGHKAYGVFVAPGTGYRNNHTSGIATGDQSEGCTRSSKARTTTAVAASTAATPRPAASTPATAIWRPSTSATTESGARGSATANAVALYAAGLSAPLFTTSIASEGAPPPSDSCAHSGTTYGNWSVCCALVVAGVRPLGTAMLVTRDITASGALSARVRPLRVAKPKDAGVPTT